MARPTPFSRPSINLGGGPKKDWIETEVKNLSKGDNVRGWGTVETITVGEEAVIIGWQSGKMSILDPHDVVTAFTSV